MFNTDILNLKDDIMMSQEEINADLFNEVKRLKAENRLLNDVFRGAVIKAVNDKKETTLLCTIGSSESEDGDRYGLKLLGSEEVMLDIRTLPRGLKLEVSVKQIA